MQRIEHHIRHTHDLPEIALAQQWQHLDLLAWRQAAQLHPRREAVQERLSLAAGHAGEEDQHRIVVARQHLEEQSIGIRVDFVEELRTQVDSLVARQSGAIALGFLHARRSRVASAEPG